MNETPSPPPAPSPGHLEVAHDNQAVLVRVFGLGNMNISLTLKDFIRTSLDQGYGHFALDLGPCEGMDSTFMGTLVGIASMVQDPGGWICLLNVGEANRKLLDMIGVWGMLPVRETFPLADVETERLEGEENPRRRLAHIKSAHEHLVAIDARNRDRFGQFLDTLESEMGGETPPPAEPKENCRDSQRIYRMRSFAKGEERTPPEAEGE